MTKVFKKAARDLVVGDRVDLRDCPYLKHTPIAREMLAEVGSVEHEAPSTIVIGYEGIDHVGYPSDTVLTVRPNQIYLVPKTLTVCDTQDGEPMIGFDDPVSGVAIFDPTTSACGRFQVEPESYGISAEDAQALKSLNDTVKSAAEAALDAMCAPLQEHLGVATGDFAGLYFSGTQNTKEVLRTAMAYAVAQIEYAKTELVDSEEARGQE
jgi:hypothetical protein